MFGAALRDAGEVLMQTFSEDPPRLCGELLRLCRNIVRASSGAEAAGKIEAGNGEDVGAEIVLRPVAEEAVARAEKYVMTLLIACLCPRSASIVTPLWFQAQLHGIVLYASEEEG
eukprot:3104518-Rhodomonas_salina.4